MAMPLTKSWTSAMKRLSKSARRAVAGTEMPRRAHGRAGYKDLVAGQFPEAAAAIDTAPAPDLTFGPLTGKWRGFVFFNGENDQRSRP